MIKQIQGLRGVMCLAVILNHLSIVFYSNLYNPNNDGSLTSILGNSPINMFWDGNLAVIVFFTLSGFLIANSIWKKDRIRLKDTCKNVVKRYLRLMPNIFVSVMGMCMLMKMHLCRHSDIVSAIGSDYVEEYNMFSPSFGNAFVEGVVGAFFKGSIYNSPLWTIPWEMWGGTTSYTMYYACET